METTKILKTDRPGKIKITGDLFNKETGKTDRITISKFDLVNDVMGFQIEIGYGKMMYIAPHKELEKLSEVTNLKVELVETQSGIKKATIAPIKTTEE